MAAGTALWTAVFLFTLSSGAQIESVGMQYGTQDQCLLQTEADAKNLAREWEAAAHETGRPGFFKSVDVSCRLMPKMKDSKDETAWEEPDAGAVRRASRRGR